MIASILKGKNALRWTRLSCHSFRHNAVRLRLHALAYNLANFLRTLALPTEVEHWSLTTLREKLVKIGAPDRAPWPLHRVPVGRGRSVAGPVYRDPAPHQPPAAEATPYQHEDREQWTTTIRPVRCVR
jgi:Transposase DDE domain group 1